MTARLEQLMRKLAALLLIVLPAAFAVASEVEVVALFKDRAVLRTAGAERMLKVGETSPDGVELLAADARGARVRYSGQIHTLLSAPPLPARSAHLPRRGSPSRRTARDSTGWPAPSTGSPPNSWSTPGPRWW